MSSEVEQIKSRLDVVDVISDYVRLTQSGQNFKGLCPFHGEKTPSFMAHREKQIWHCFGCGEGGDIFSFVQKIENVDFSEALEILARKAHIELKKVNPSEISQRQKVFHALELAQAFFVTQLNKSAVAEKTREYVNSRAITTESLTTFGVGYSLPDWDKLHIFLKSRGVTLQDAMQAGLVLKSERGPGAYDRFRGRLMFPIAELSGRIVGFGGRTLEANAKEAKYINSPQGPVYNKSFIVYNLDRAKNYIKEAGHAVLVEGYMDVVASWQAGVKNVVATSGTALTQEQIKLLKRYTNEFRLAFDADLAGQNARDRGVDLALQAEVEVKIITLPFGKDPDECARQDAAAYRQATIDALPIGDHAFKTVLTKSDITTREGKKTAAKLLLAVVAKLPDAVERDHYIKRLSKELGVEKQALLERLPTVGKSTVIKKIPVVAAAVKIASRQEMLADRLFTLLLKPNVAVAQPLADLISQALPEPYAGLYKYLKTQYNDKHYLDFDELKIELASEPKLSQLLDTLFLQGERDFAESTEAEVATEFKTLIISLKTDYYSDELKRLSVRIREAERLGENSEVSELLARFSELSQELNRLKS